MEGSAGTTRHSRPSRIVSTMSGRRVTHSASASSPADRYLPSLSNRFRRCDRAGVRIARPTGVRRPQCGELEERREGWFIVPVVAAVDIFVWSPNSRLRCGERLVRLATARPKPGRAEAERRPQTLVSPSLPTVDANGISHGCSRPKRRARWLAAVRAR